MSRRTRVQAAAASTDDRLSTRSLDANDPPGRLTRSELTTRPSAHAGSSARLKVTAVVPLRPEARSVLTLVSVRLPADEKRGVESVCATATLLTCVESKDLLWSHVNGSVMMVAGPRTCGRRGQ
jgi:hypothetical protein